MTAPDSKTTLEASAATCIVGCKLPHGLVLELTNKSGEKTIVRVRGMNSKRIIGGYGLTDGVPTDFMTEWLRVNRKHPAVLNGAVFMHTSVAGAEARAREGRKELTGLEAIDPVANAKARGLELDKEAVAAYERQKAENPLNGRQIVE